MDLATLTVDIYLHRMSSSYGMLHSFSLNFYSRRSDGDTLELMHSSFDNCLSDWLKVCFSGSAVVNCCLTSGKGVVECLVCTSNGGAKLSFSVGLAIFVLMGCRHLVNSPIFSKTILIFMRFIK